LSHPETVVTPETAITPKAVKLTEAEMLDRARAFELQQQKADIIRRNQARLKAGLPGLVNPVPVTGSDDTTSSDDNNNNQARMPELLKKDEKDIIEALKKQTGATTGELKQQAADNGMDFNSFLIRFGLGLLAGESQYAAVNVGKAGLSALDAQLAEQKSRQAQALNLSDIEYRKAASRKATAEADYLERFGKDKNLALEAEKLIAQKLKDLPAFVQAEVAADPTRLEAIEKKVRQEIYLQLGLNPIMAAGAPTGGAKFLGFENPA
jgi:hypothetical protein